MVLLGKTMELCEKKTYGTMEKNYETILKTMHL